MKRLSINVTVESVRAFGSTEHTGEASFSLDFATDVPIEVQAKFIDIIPVLITAAGEAHSEKISEQAPIKK